MSIHTGGLAMLRKMLPQLPPSEAKIAEYILEHPQESLTLTANDLGKKSSTSGAAVIRLCKSLDLSGLQELKLRISGDLIRNTKEVFRDIEPNESQGMIIEKMTANSIQTIRETSEVLRPDDLTKAVKTLIKAKSIHFFGVGGSGIVAQDAQQKFLRINKNATYFSDLHMAATIIANGGPDDVVVGISFSGQTTEVIKIIDLANKVGSKTISITSYGANPVANLAQISLYNSATKEATFRSGATSSRIAQLHVIDIMFMCVATQIYDDVITYIDQTREAVKFIGKK